LISVNNLARNNSPDSIAKNIITVAAYTKQQSPKLQESSYPKLGLVLNQFLTIFL